ncbi:OmpA family protein [Chondromyces crocatus]|uniref:OmpA-like domain-containing protein n=1 Tax=Chondromyces crocatus TaxID=52 RepID=A0A0K1ET56_CHOCO|nr:OmpA family protein [Chondromyces crocatus]AKT43984.1 OmpA-like domain-containing protein [Chondromyces crocatus]
MTVLSRSHWSDSGSPALHSSGRIGRAFRGLSLSLAAALVGLGALLVPASEAAAQTSPTRAGGTTGNGDGMDLHLFRPSVDSKGFFGVNGADILGANDISLGLIIDYGHGLVPLAPNPNDTDALIKHAFQGTFQFNYGIANWLTVGLSAPVVLSGGDAIQGIGPTGRTYNDDDAEAQALGNLALHVKLRLLRPASDPIGLSIIAQAGYGVGGSADLSAEPGFWYWPQVVIERHFGSTSMFRIGANVGFRGHTGANAAFGLRPDGTPQLENGELEYGNLVTGGLGVSLRVLGPLDLVAESYGTYLVGGRSAAKQRLSAEALGGIKLFIERNSFLMLGAGLGYLPGFQSAGLRGTIGFVFEPSIGDRDGDGIKDDEDDCPDEPEDFDGFQDTKSDSPPGKYGCPDPDNDNDGIPDIDDRCPNNPEDRDGDEDEDGCPEGNDGDRDGDGILDSRDKCPDEPEDRDGFEDKDGCPDPDNDKDGIPDKVDQCPNDPEDKDGFEDEDGCPDPDNDNDGIPDVKDQCPNEPETFNGKDDEDGCPDRGGVIVEENNILILEKINFETGSAKILPESNGILDAVATTLKAHPEFTLVEVQGHADERGNDLTNLRLTEARSKSVVEALVQRGVNRNSLRSMGYGEYCPLEAAHNAEAWEKNRRVEFKVVKSDKGDTGVELGCQLARDKGVKPPAP